ncbi:hypothetical protein [Mycolicibacterium madagascariense]|uniref:hypothetical protein n=1 Tax=Mycolicibacterium madagascariense TaxID=212765 RepID=UPI0013D8214D|nr:hypothetical protein [Mycolicibacterium madagascariense]MCV7011211.1 hypothetical protein [Mycolicibacterium madagascariense]
MTTAGAARSTVPSALELDEEPRVVVVYNCTRIGLRANPPGFSIRNLFRVRRRRR